MEAGGKNGGDERRGRKWGKAGMRGGKKAVRVNGKKGGGENKRVMIGKEKDKRKGEAVKSEKVNRKRTRVDGV